MCREREREREKGRYREMRERERLIDRYIQKQRVRLKIGREKEEKPRVHQCITLCMYVVYLIIRVGLFS